MYYILQLYPTTFIFDLDNNRTHSLIMDIICAKFDQHTCISVACTSPTHPQSFNKPNSTQEKVQHA